MRILYSHRIQSRDGQSVHVEELIAALRELGHEVLVVGPGFYEQAEFGGESGLVAAIRARLPRAMAELAELAYNVPAWWRLRLACRRFRPDLIYERYNLYYLAGTLVARRTGHPTVPGSECAAGRGDAAGMADWACRDWPVGRSVSSGARRIGCWRSPGC